MAPTFTVVCVYNSQATLEKYLEAGLRRQGAPFELRLVDNRNGRFRSAAAALNHGAEGATGDYLVFVHQDVELLSPTFFESAAVHLSTLPNLGVAGIVGAVTRRGLTTLRGRCLQGDADAGRFSPGYHAPEQVETVDEQLLIVPRAWFQELAFDPVACPAWDLYGVEFALSSAARGRDVVVLPLPVRHASWGKLRWTYFESLVTLQHKHRAIQILPTTCGTWRAARPAWAHFAAHRVRAARGRLRKRLPRWLLP